MALLQLDAQQLPHQVRIADLGRKAEQAGSGLGIEDRGHRRAGQGQEDLYVLARGMHDLADRGGAQQRGQRLEILDLQRVQQQDPPAHRHLDQAQPGKIGPFADELRVQRPAGVGVQSGHDVGKAFWRVQ